MRKQSIIAFGAAAAAFVLYALTLLPGVGGGDTAEFQRVAPTLGLAHSTGYPLYSLLGFVWSHLVPVGTPAWRMNLFSALAAAGAVGGCAAIVQHLRVAGDPGLGGGWRRLPAIGAAALAAVGLAFWQQATHAEIYALAALLEVGLFGALLAWRAGRAPFWTLGLAGGLVLLHHRTGALLAPGALLFVVLARPNPYGHGGESMAGLARSRLTWRDWARAALALVLVLPIYLYVPWRAAPWQDRWALLGEYLSGGVGREWLRPERLLDEGWERIGALLRILVIPQFTWLGVGLALVGAISLLRRDRAAAALLLVSYAAIFGFCASYYVDDLDVFFIAGHLIQAILIGAGVASIADRAASWNPRTRWPGALAGAGLLALALYLAARNLPTVRAANNDAAERAARSRLAAPLAPGALLIGDGYAIESLRYLQSVEGLRPDIEYGFQADAGYIRAALDRDRAVYLLQPAPGLGLSQRLEAGLWRVTDEPLAIATAAAIEWDQGISLSGYTLPAGPFRAGDAVLLALRWQATAQPAGDYVRFVHIIGPDGAIWGQEDGQPAEGATSTWRAGATVLDLAAPTLKAGAPPGTYQVVVGWYNPSDLTRLARRDQPADRATLGGFEVRP